jgi:hypothetical protein
MIATAGYLAELGRLYVAVTLAVAAVGKGLALGPFVASTANLLGLTRTPAHFVAVAVIAAEGAIAVLLLLGGYLSQIGMAAALLLFLAFTGVLAAALVRRRTVHCNCFGGRGHKVSGYDLLRNATLIVAGGWYLGNQPLSVVLGPSDHALLLGCALILFLVSAHLREIRSLTMSLEA